MVCMCYKLSCILYKETIWSKDIVFIDLGIWQRKIGDVSEKEKIKYMAVFGRGKRTGKVMWIYYNLKGWKNYFKNPK